MLGVAILVAVLLWEASSGDTTITRRVVGNGTGRFQSRTESTNGWGAVAALAALTAGVAGWMLLHPGGEFRRKLADLGPTAAAILLLPAIGGIFIAAGRRTDFSFEPRESYSDAQAIIEAMGKGGLDCTNIETGPANDSYWDGPETTCDLPTRAAIEDGADTLVIDMWRGDEGRDRWMSAVSHESVFALFGPTWLIRCEFQSDCALIQQAIGGLHY